MQNVRCRVFLRVSGLDRHIGTADVRNGVSKFTPLRSAVSEGLVLGPSTIWDVKRAAEYLALESAAVCANLTGGLKVVK